MTTPSSTAQLAEALRAQLTTTVTQSLDQFAGHLAIVIQANPQGSLTHVLDRPDVQQSQAAALASARSAARAALAQAYEAAFPGQSDSSVLYQSLAADIDKAYAQAPQAIRHALQQAFHDHPDVPFQIGIHQPGENPSHQAALQRAQAARDAITVQGSSLALRNGLSVAVAHTGGRTEAALDGAPAGSGKRWRASMDGKDPRSCYWCRSLHGTVVPADQEFPHPATFEGHAPPKLYLGVLHGPPLHPNCRCRVEVVASAPSVPVGSQPTAPIEAAPMLSSEDVAALPPERYSQLRHFLGSALHELGQMISRLLKLGT